MNFRFIPKLSLKVWEKQIIIDRRTLPFQCWDFFRPKHKDAKILENNLNHVMLVFIRYFSLSTLRWVPMFHVFSHFLKLFLHHFVLAKLTTSSIRVESSVNGLTAWLISPDVPVIFLNMREADNTCYRNFKCGWVNNDDRACRSCGRDG